MTRTAWARGWVRTAVALGSVLALAAAGSVVALVTSGSDGAGRTGSGESQVLGLTEVPVGYRLVGQGHVGVLVPADWPDAAYRCGAPAQDTVVVDQPFSVARCPQESSAYWPEGVVLVALTTRHPEDVDHPADRSLDGLRVQRGRVRCDSPTPPRCVGALWVPAEGVGVEVGAMTSAAEVEKLLDQVRIVLDLVGVPSVDDARRRAGQALVALNPGHMDDARRDALLGVLRLDYDVRGETWLAGRTWVEYEAELALLGLRAQEIDTGDRRLDRCTAAGLRVQPAPGTMLPLGSVVVLREQPTW